MGVFIFIVIIIILSNLFTSGSSSSSNSSSSSYNRSSNSKPSSYSGYSGSRTTTSSTSSSSVSSDTIQDILSGSPRSSYASVRSGNTSRFNTDSSISFKSVSKRGVTNYYLYDYYPLNRFPNLYGTDSNNRQLVWRFKDGKNAAEVASRISSALINKFGNTALSNKTICIIPASTSSKTLNRFNFFCQKVSYNTGMQNGYGLLSNSSDREAIHNNNNRAINHSSYILFGNVSGKDIVLFDDVITTGKSFENVRATLIRKGARSVTGVFLARTHWE